MNHPVRSLTGPCRFDAEECARFHRLGYRVLPSFLDADRIERLKAEVDAFMADQAAPIDPYAEPSALARMQIEYDEHGLLTTDPTLMGLIAQLMDHPRFSLHHLHTARHDVGCHGVHWHHDYEQLPQANRSHLMVHVFFYLNGLDGTIGDLMLQPGSHERVMERNAVDFFGTAELPGSLVIDRLPPGSAVLVHSAVLHARRPKPGGEGRPRYFIDSSYCHGAGRWPVPSLSRQVEMSARALRRGLDRNGDFGFVYDTSCFFDAQEAWEVLKPINRGSLVERLERVS